MILQMKHKGSVVEYADKRIADLMRAYTQYMASCKHISMPDVYHNIVNMPSSRFWVSDTRAALVISSIMRGERPLRTMWPLKKEMYEEIYRRVKKLKKKRPECSISELCTIIVSQPAPKFYLTAGSAKVMICKAKKKWREENKKRQLFA